MGIFLRSVDVCFSEEKLEIEIGFGVGFNAVFNFCSLLSSS